MGALKVLTSLMHRKWTRSCRCQSETIYSRNIGLEGKIPHYVVQVYNEENLEELYFLPVFIPPFFSSSPPAFLAFFLSSYSFSFFLFLPFFLLLLLFYIFFLLFLFLCGIYSRTLTLFIL